MIKNEGMSTSQSGSRGVFSKARLKSKKSARPLALSTCVKDLALINRGRSTVACCLLDLAPDAKYVMLS